MIRRFDYQNADGFIRVVANKGEHIGIESGWILLAQGKNVHLRVSVDQVIDIEYAHPLKPVEEPEVIEDISKHPDSKEILEKMTEPVEVKVEPEKDE